MEAAQEARQAVDFGLQALQGVEHRERQVLLVLQRLHHCLHAGERVADLVCHAHRQFAHGGHLLDLEQLAVELAALVLEPAFFADIARHDHMGVRLSVVG